MALGIEYHFGYEAEAVCRIIRARERVMQRLVQLSILDRAGQSHLRELPFVPAVPSAPHADAQLCFVGWLGVAASKDGQRDCHCA
jgi:hypothetical protein